VCTAGHLVRAYKMVNPKDVKRMVDRGYEMFLDGESSLYNAESLTEYHNTTIFAR